MFGISRFHIYLFGREFEVLSDHKPLEMIWRKPLLSAPPRLRKLLIKLQGYDFNVTYKPGSQMVLSDTVSRLPNPNSKDDIPLDILVESMNLEDTEETMQIDLVNFGRSKQEALQQQTSMDPVLKSTQPDHNCWMARYSHRVTHKPAPILAHRDELGIANGVIFKERQVMIPESLRPDIISQLHQGHQGIEKTRSLARESVYWPNINKDIEQMVKACEICQKLQPSNQKEPLKPHDIPSTPWTKLASDLFTIEGEDFLLVTDYHSKYPVVTNLSNTKCETVAKAISSTFSLFGPPQEIVTNNGPQYIGKPFEQMCWKWNVQHTTSSPRYPRSNGLAERTVRSVKTSSRNAKHLDRISRLPCFTSEQHQSMLTYHHQLR